MVRAETTGTGHPSQAAFLRAGRSSNTSSEASLYTTGSVPSGATPPPVSASSYVVIVTRVTRWIPRLPAEPYPGVHALLPVKVLYASSTTSPIGPLWWIPEGVVYSRSTLLSSLHTTATLQRSLPLQGPSSGFSVAYRVSSRITLSTIRLATSAMASSPS